MKTCRRCLKATPSSKSTLFFKSVQCRGSYLAIAIHDRPCLRHRAKKPSIQSPVKLVQQSSSMDLQRVQTARRLIPLKSATSEELVLSTVKFSVPVEVDYGESVRIVGNHPALGAWDTMNGVELEWTNGHVWEKQICITPGEYEFKCVIVRAQGISKWEPGPNRVLKIEEGQTTVEVGCKWWHTGMNIISFSDPFGVNKPIRENGRSVVSNRKETESKELHLVAAGHSVPHIDKGEDKGEDAFFVSTARNGVIGVADGVSSWSKEGIDPSMYPKGLMKEAKKSVESKGKKVFDARETMMVAQNKNTVIGSSTCIIAILDGNSLDVANVGDSELKIIRDGKIVFSTKPQEHEFNCPHQLAYMDYTHGDKAMDAEVYTFKVSDGDILVVGTDGIFDNLWNEELEEVVEVSMKGLDRSEFSAMATASAIALAAHQRAQDTKYYSPWTADATRAAGQTSEADELVMERTDNPYLGGKMDDCTAVVAFVTPKD